MWEIDWFIEISDEYMVDELHKICEKKLLSKIANDNVCQILITADSLSLKELKQECKNLMIKEFFNFVFRHWVYGCEV